MANIKDVAKAAGVSPTTVSLIINGKAKNGRISEETEKHVYQVMQELNYHPNMSARRLRTDEPPRTTIAFYWPNDYRSNILSDFLTSYTLIRDELGFDFDLVILSYKNGELEKSADPIKKNSYNGIIIGGTSPEDLAFLESASTRTPIVLLNRKSDKYSSVIFDNEGMGSIAADLIRQKGYTRAAVFTGTDQYEGGQKRIKSFMKACAERNIETGDPWLFKTDGTPKSGAAAAAAYCESENPPKVIFCDSDFTALGALYEFYVRGIRVPEEAEVIAVQFMADDFVHYSMPYLTTLTMPNTAMFKTALQILNKQIDEHTAEAVHETIGASINNRM